MKIYYQILLRHLKYVKENISELDQELFLEAFEGHLENTQDYHILKTQVNNVLLFLNTYIEQFDSDVQYFEEIEDEES